MSPTRIYKEITKPSNYGRSYFLDNLGVLTQKAKEYISPPTYLVKSLETWTQLFRKSENADPKYAMYFLKGMKLKWLGFDTKKNVAITGTRKKNKICITDDMGPCIGIAIGAKNPNTQEVEVGIAHINFKKNDISQVKAYIQALKNEGMEVTVALHGGDHIASQHKVSNAEVMTKMMEEELKVKVEFNETGDNRQNRRTVLGVMIDDNNEIKFITQLLTP